MLRLKRKPRIENPKIVMTLLVRDEADIIDAFIRYHSRIGIDALIVTDNGSNDGTREILESHLRHGAITEIIDEPIHTFQQARFVNRMICRARDYFAADYCINSDADEFWRPASGSFRNELSRSRANIIQCTSFNMLPASAGGLFWLSTDRVARRAKAEKIGKRRDYNLFDYPGHKSIHRMLGYRMIGAGNHDVVMDDEVIEQSKDIWIYHYSLRSISQFQKKIIQNGAALELNKDAPESEGAHWRYLYRGYKAGMLDFEAEFYNITGRENLADFQKAGVVVSDFKMRDALAEMQEK
jgi:glycosyltransferase involved in cell wall biosynthesis